MTQTPRTDRARGNALITLLTGLIALLTAVIGLMAVVYKPADRNGISDREVRLSETRFTHEAQSPVGVGMDSARAEPGDSLRAVDSPAQGSLMPRTGSEPVQAPREQRPAAARVEPRPEVAETERSAVPPADPHVKVMYDYRFEMHGCEAGGPLVTCHISVTSLRRDRTLTIGGFSYLSTQAEGIRSVAYTADGMNHFAAEASLGSVRSRGAPFTSVVEGQPMAATVVFDDVPAGTSAFTRMRIAFGSDRQEFRVPFESVPIR